MKKKIESIAEPMPMRNVKEGVTECRNLRRAAAGGLVTVGDPVRVADGDMRPLVTIRSAGGSRCLIMSSGYDVYAADPAVPDSCRLIAELTSEATSALATPDGTVILFTAGGPVRMRCDAASGTWNTSGYPPVLPPVVIKADDQAVLSATVEGFTLSGAYPHCNEPLSGADRTAVGSRLSAAVEKLTESASMAGRLLHPRLMAYRIYDSGGRCVGRSVPVWVGPVGGGLGLTDMIGADLERRDEGVCAAGAFSVSATAYKAVIEIPRRISAGMADDAALLEIVASPLITPYRPGAQTGCRLRAVSQSAGRLEAYIPGASNGMVPATERHAAMVESVLEQFWATAETVDTIPRPFNGGFNGDEGGRYVIPLRASLTAAEAATRLGRVVSAPVTAADSSENAVIAASQTPHTFTADGVLAAADMTVYYGLSLMRGAAPDALLLAAGSVTAVTEADAAAHYTAVEFSDGSGDMAVTSDLSPAAIPSAIGPVTVYPDPDASVLTVVTRGANGIVNRLRLPLRRSRTGNFAYHIATDLKPVPLTADGAPFVLPVDRRKPRHLPGVVAVARSVDPFRILAAPTVSATAVHRVVPAVRSASAWDFARQHLLVFTADSICSMSVDAGRHNVAVNRLYPIGVSRPDAVATAPGAIYAALSNGALVRVCGSRIYSFDPEAGAAAAVWCPSRDELWLALADGSVRVVDPGSLTAYTRTFGPVLSFHDTDGMPCASTATGLFDISSENDSWSMPVGWSVRVPVPYGEYPRRLSVDMQGADLDLTLALRADNGPGAASSLPVVTLRLNGSVNAPVHARIASPHRRWLTLSVSGLAGPGTSVGRWEISAMNIYRKSPRQ